LIFITNTKYGLTVTLFFGTNNVHNCFMFNEKHAGMSLMSLTWGKAPPPNPAALHHWCWNSCRSPVWKHEKKASQSEDI